MVDGLLQIPHGVQRQHKGMCCPILRVQGPCWVPITTQPITPCSSWQQQTLGTTKPRYLEQLENYLRKELLLLDLSTDSAQELKLQVRAADYSRNGMGKRWEEALLIRTEPFRPSGETSLSQFFWVPLSGKRNMFFDKASD